MNVSRVVRMISWAVVLAAQALFADISPADLRCGRCQNPLGIDDAHPNLGWRVEATSPGERGQRQTAYQVLVASSTSILAGDTGDLWDSGKVISEQSLNNPYGGVPLASGQEAFWKVRVWDRNDHPSAWSSAATWTMGLLNPADWQANWICAPSNNLSLSGCSWIWYPEGNPASSAPPGTRYFRTNVSVRADSALTSAILLLAVDDSYAAYVNGTQVGQGTDYKTATAVFVATQLHPGINTLAIAATNTGTIANPAGVLGKLILSYADGGETTVPMDGSWKTSNQLQTGWQSPGFDDSSWVGAMNLGSYGMSPWTTRVTISVSPLAPLPIFRRQFVVGAGLQRALIHICGLGHYELTVNGAKVGSSLLAPGWSKYDKTCLYDTLELTPYLTNGANAVGVMLGNGFYNIPPSARYSKLTGSFGPPKLIAQIQLFYGNGASNVIPTDANWLVTQGPITFSTVYGGEDHDARFEFAGWNQANFNASAWQAAAVTTGPGGILRGLSYAAPPIQAIQTLQPVRTNSISSSVSVYDLGQNASVMLRLTTHGQAGAVVRVTPAELLNADGTVDRRSCQGAAGGTAYWQYTLAGSGAETWLPRFFYQGCRYLQVGLTAASGSSQLPVVDSLDGVVVQSSSTPVGDFSCSNDLFNRIRTLIRWAQRNNEVSLITDCPAREHLGWLEQSHLSGPSLRYEFDLAQLYAKIMGDMADSQVTTGTLTGLVPDTAPEYAVFNAGFRDSPEWGSAAVLVPWQQYLWTGDDTLLRRYYGVMSNYLAYLQTKINTNNLYAAYSNLGLGDWYDLGPGSLGKSQLTPVQLTASAFYYQDAQILADTAGVLGRTSDAARFASLATNIRTAFNKTFYSATKGYYATNSQTAQAIPLVMGLVDDQNRSNVVAALVSNVYTQGLTAGDIGHRYLLRALADAGRSDAVFYLHSQTNQPGYGYILNKGATALTESWDALNTLSQDHFMLGHIMEWFYHDLAGIQPDPATLGFKGIIINPALVGGISWAQGQFDSPQGRISNYWALATNGLTLNVTIPVGSTAQVYVPAASAALVWEGSVPAAQAEDVQFLRMENGCAIYEVGSGSYAFSVPPPGSPTGLRATAVSSNQINLAWTDNTTNETGFAVACGPNSGGPYTNIATVAANTTNYSHTGLAELTTYYYVVRAVYMQGTSPDSNEASATTLPVNPAPIVLTAPANNAIFAAPATIGLAATVTANGTTINHVSFYNGGTLLSNVTTSPYACSWTAAAPGTYFLWAQAVYNGGSTTNSATNTIFVINSSPTTTVLTGTGSPTSYGVTVTFTATVTGSALSGTVQFQDGGVNLDSPVALSGGQAQLGISTLSVPGSPHSITAVYSGDINNRGSTSSALLQTINPITSATLLISSLNPSTVGSNVTFTATVKAAAGTPAGNVVFLANGTPFSTNALVDGVAQASMVSLPVGTNTIVANYATQDNYVASTRSRTQVVSSGAPCSLTNAIVSIVGNPNGSFTLTFQGTPQAQYCVVANPNVRAGMSNWAPLPGSTNTAPSPTGQWSFIVTNAAPQYYRSKTVTP